MQATKDKRAKLDGQAATIESMGIREGTKEGTPGIAKEKRKLEGTDDKASRRKGQNLSF